MTHLRLMVGIGLIAVLLGLLSIANSEPRLATSDGTEPHETSGQIFKLGPEDDFQAALDQTVSGDTIELQAGAVYYGPFVLKQHAGTGWVTILSSENALSPLPSSGTRVTPANRPAMATLVSASNSVISTEPGAAWYRFVGVEIRPGNRGSVPNNVAGTRTTITNLVELSALDNSAANMPHHIKFERSYLHGDPVWGTRRGIVFNGAHMEIVDSHLADFKSSEDSQAVAGWEGTGPYLIENNYLEAAGENVMFGGADPSVEGRIPADITITRNHFSKPLSWQSTNEGFVGPQWRVKNLLELKNAQRVLIDGNLFEHNWIQAQNGFAILFTVRNQDGASPWSQVNDVTFSNNIVRKVGGGINILGYDDIHESARTQQLRISNNLFYEVGGVWGNGRLLQFLGSPADIELTHNTALQDEAIVFMEGDPIPDVEIRGNLFNANQAGISGTGTSPGKGSIDTYLAPTSTIEGNLFIAPGHNVYPPGISQVPDTASVPFADFAKQDFRLLQRPAGFAQTPGVDFAQLCSALSSLERPSYC